MLQAAQAISKYVERGRQKFDDDEALRDAILYNMVVPGEAAKEAVRLHPDLQEELSEIEFSVIARMRDRLAHHYWATDREIVWSTASQDIPQLIAALQAALGRY